MHFFYFTKKQWALQAIRDEQLKISLYDSLNDPFDFIGIATTTPKDREALKRKRAELGEKQGIVCFSERWKQPLMWGHYAEAHKGICLGFYVRTSEFRKMDYVAERPKLEDFKKSYVGQLSEADIKAISMKKFNQWSYEAEWRRVVPLENQDFVDSNYFLKFDDAMKLNVVLIGERCDITDKQIAGMLAANENIRIGFTKAASSKFDVVLDMEKTRDRIPSHRRAHPRFTGTAVEKLDYLQKTVTNPHWKSEDED